jgi:hypothetical protein
MQRIRADRLTLAGIPVTVVQVPSYLVHNGPEAKRAIAEYTTKFEGDSIVLAAMAGARPIHFGDRNLIAALARVSPFRIHWQDFTFASADQQEHSG